MCLYYKENSKPIKKYTNNKPACFGYDLEHIFEYIFDYKQNLSTNQA